ncbi:RNA 2',3'-cyclic phosphodiesterase [Phaeovibrio sulfidiphilus]|uniref:RNA 2',3'-cyclic phosphodiesterase n=1 Tax=Phaeovibrio sulfidiphilus TaxID=1220600 RepID=A0A8J7CBR2_9PROT|nr:RNA 2',3'-cyclic phosphodiesterase [Phaeovibrio sulfidiphilus]MBE1236453.1 RNA 2',3'-cyclic phosphodiesterase [Phaeovibrio sulfidiphilus]
MIRLFTAIALPEAVRDHLEDLSAVLPGATWMDGDALHLTLRFIGEVDEDVADGIHAALSRVRAAPFEVSVRDLGVFGKDHRARILWAGVELSGALRGLKASIDTALRSQGLELEKRRYTPHITLARLKNPDEIRLRDFVESRNLAASVRFRAESFSLYSSVLTRGGAHYTQEAVYPLGAGAGAVPVVAPDDPWPL